MVCHPLDFDDYGTKPVDYVQVGFASCPGVAVVQFVFAAVGVFEGVLGANFFIAIWRVSNNAIEGWINLRHPLRYTGVKFVEHTHLLDIVLLLIEAPSRLHRSLQHTRPDTKIPRRRSCIFFAVGTPFGIRRGGVAQPEGKEGGGMFSLELCVEDFALFYIFPDVRVIMIVIEGYCH